MAIAFLTLMNYARILCTPTHTIPNKSHLGEGLRAFSTRGNRHALSCRTARLCLGPLISHPQQTGEFCWTEFLPHSLKKNSAFKAALNL